jgi:Ca-activated chloride channel family protein
VPKTYAGIVAVAVAITGMSAFAGSQQVFRAGVDLVHFGVVVTDRAGQPVSGLKVEDFEVLEEGKPQTMKFFAGGDGEDAPPVHLGFMIDLSGSMAEDIKDVRTAAIKFLDAIRNVEDITIVDFDTEVRTARFASDDPRLVERIRARKPDGYTALYDALGTYLNGASAQTGEKILVMYTDGGDTRSAINQGELLDLLKASDVTVYAIGYLEHQGSARGEQQQVLQRFAAATGGQAFFPGRLKDVDKMYEKILRDISSRYSMGYVSTDTRMDGKWRDVRIRVIRPDLKDARIRTRPGYFAPYKAH